ncbi:hypothetical protein [Streptomyces sp. NPDC059466]|uniref:hypothetical protein n=1 Tax=unclassified Streptomyces TaxID=2593676 RepID=UPI0036BF5948
MPRSHTESTTKNALAVAFSESSRGDLHSFAELTDGQQRLLRALVKVGPWGAYGKKFEESLRSRQLPDTRAALRAYVGVPDDGRDDTTECIWS